MVVAETPAPVVVAETTAPVVAPETPAAPEKTTEKPVVVEEEKPAETEEEGEARIVDNHAEKRGKRPEIILLEPRTRDLTDRN